MNNGWIKLHRSLLGWEWFADPPTAHLFNYCILRANHAPANWRGMSINRGQFWTSLPTISAETGLSVQNIRTSLVKLSSTGELTDESKSTGRMITVNNYHKYQLPTDESTDDQQTSNRRVTANKKNKKEKNEKNKTSDDVERVWNHYPLKKGKKGAIKGIHKALTTYSADELINRIEAYARTQNPKYYAHGSTYFNQERYEDDLTPVQSQPKQAW